MSNGLPVIENHKLGFRASQNGLWAIGASRQEALRNLKRHQMSHKKKQAAERRVMASAFSGETPAVFTRFTITGGVVCVVGMRIGIGATRAEAFVNAVNNEIKPLNWLLDNAKVIQGEDGTVQVQAPFLNVSGKNRKEAEARIKEIATAIINWIFSGKARPAMDGLPADVVHYTMFNRGRWADGDTLVAARNASALSAPTDEPITQHLPIELVDDKAQVTATE